MINLEATAVEEDRRECTDFSFSPSESKAINTSS
jgi:hypothetical protein